MKTINIRFCPKCNGTEIIQYAGGITGVWKCSKCGFISAIFPERVIGIKEENKNDRRK